MHRGGNHYDKYATRNPIARYLMARFLTAFDELTEIAQPRAAFDAGCGEGHLSQRLATRGIAVRGCDSDSDIVAEANERLTLQNHTAPFFVSRIEDIPNNESLADLVVCCEVLEHIEQPQKALDRLILLSEKYLLLSVPREPIWRVLNVARGAYLNDLGNTPGHINHWSSSDFISFVESRARIVTVRQPLPWTMVLCRI